ncbi:hypothetical protein G6F46_000929 [Rhizopus delemar]|uniref:C3H1-type domain-containing protein n=3 Tax=Rhizopus TaxID=4842 RepID=I1CM94_RHIO9|nr:hypothetical protein RO3G_14285 [Rhizopus delemar RA 99-880]KAG1466511.1 hypothetical protein G6F55_000426 [Rhizopus delemar]KAG1552637.1 hypothetical protein G6F51_001104 [Rhizopus arrhizus]KAG1504534.1 hypothetical protein G6F54_000943 [Rhizopus delemar]KAG1518233.1 hypothetical protein G6F53_000739 [Rhizopus delemar]|eukprot:EIE89574.1 hypothetical protein RO3G_14285 [Rhizopus delemar RA 99-880]
MIYNTIETNQHHYNHSRLPPTPSVPIWSIQNLSQSFLQLQTPMSHQKAPSTNPRISLKYGSKCRYAHGEEEIRIVPRHARYKTQICRAYHSDGSCPYGTRCTFIHDSDSPIDRKEANSSLMTASNTNGSTDNIDFIWNGKLSFKSNSMKQTFPVVSIPRRDSFTSHDGSSSETSFSGDESSLINSPASLTNSFIMKQPNAAIETMKYYRADRTLQALFSTNKNKPLWM